MYRVQDLPTAGNLQNSRCNDSRPRLTQADVRDLMDRGIAAFCRARPGRQRRGVWFNWRRRRYICRATCFRYVVNTAAGDPVACRYH